MEMKRPVDAMKHFTETLKRTPGRPKAIYGIGRAAEALHSGVLYLISIVRGRPSSATVILLGVLADLTMKLNFRAPGL